MQETEASLKRTGQHPAHLELSSANGTRETDVEPVADAGLMENMPFVARQRNEHFAFSARFSADAAVSKLCACQVLAHIRKSQDFVR